MEQVEKVITLSELLNQSKEVINKQEEKESRSNISNNQLINTLPEEILVSPLFAEAVKEKQLFDFEMNNKIEKTTMGKNLSPTRYGDWEKNGRCYDF